MGASAFSARRTGQSAIPLILLSLLVASCANATVGKGVADGDAAARYVNDKFAAKLTGLSDDLAGNAARESKLDWFGRIDDQKADQTVTAVQAGSPPGRYVRDHSNRDPSVYLEYLHPAGSERKYVLLGPHYSSLAPTSWVSMPYKGWNLGPCAWRGYQPVCDMLNTVGAAMERGGAAQRATSLTDGGVELAAEVTLREFLQNGVIPFPDRMLAKVTAKMKDEPIATTIRLGPDDELRSISMDATISGGEHEVEIHMNYRVLAPPTTDDLPDAPASDDVTALPDKAAVDDFYERMGEL